MFFARDNYIYKIILPPSTSQDIIDWFESMYSSDTLGQEIIAIVRNHLDSLCNQPVKEIASKNNTCLPTNLTLASSNDFIENLYNWQDSNNAIFKEEKKKMLSV